MVKVVLVSFWVVTNEIETYNLEEININIRFNTKKNINNFAWKDEQ